MEFRLSPDCLAGINTLPGASARLSVVVKIETMTI